MFERESLVVLLEELESSAGRLAEGSLAEPDEAAELIDRCCQLADSLIEQSDSLLRSDSLISPVGQEELL